MRQLAVFESQEKARRLAAFLVTQHIAAHEEQENGGFGVWVRDEDHLPQAREALAHFREHPADPRYSGVESAATAFKQKQLADREARQKNVVEMRGRWGSGPGGVRRKCPLTIGLIVVSVLSSLGMNTLFEKNGPPNSLLNGARFVRASERQSNFADVRRGQVWRLVTPIFVHYGLLHLLFNMWLMYSMGGQIEDRRGTVSFAIFVLLAAVLSNVAQAITAEWQGHVALFGGMSGVGYAVFGYLWMKVTFDPAAGYHLEKLNVVILIAWLVLCILREFPPFDAMLSMIPNAANSAHLAGLAIGMAVGYAPVLFKRR